MKFEVDGLQGFMEELEKNIVSDADKKRALTKAVNPLYDNISNNAPVLTGNLKKSLKKKVNDSSAVVSSDERYAFILEYGSSHTTKHMGYFSDAVAKSEDEVLDILTEELFKGWD